MQQAEIEINKDYKPSQQTIELLKHLPEAFDAGKGELIYDERNKLRRFVLDDGRHIIVKRYKKPNFFQTLSYSTFWENKAKKSYHFSLKLAEMGILTPMPVACVTYKHNGLVSEYFYASEEVNGTECGIVLKNIRRERDQDKFDRYVRYIAECFLNLHEKGFLHGDSNISNFICDESDGSVRISIIDINRSVFLPHPATYTECVNNMQRISNYEDIRYKLITTYAKLRDWDAQKFLEDSNNAIATFYRRKERIKKLKKIL